MNSPVILDKTLPLKDAMFVSYETSDVFHEIRTPKIFRAINDRNGSTHSAITWCGKDIGQILEEDCHWLDARLKLLMYSDFPPVSKRICQRCAKIKRLRAAA